MQHPASSDSVGLEYLRKFFDADKFVVQYHDESLYATPPANHCPNNLPPASTFSQFYKLRAVSRMVQQYEFETGARMEWVVRGRPDVAWLTRPVSVTRFEKGAVYVPQANFWPVNDQVAIVPRELMDLYYDGVDDYFKCSDAAWFPEGVGSPDCLLWRRIMTANVVMYDFDAVIVRSGNAGARCDSLTKGKNVACQVVKGFTDQLGEGLCEDMFSARLQVSLRGEGRARSEGRGSERLARNALKAQRSARNARQSQRSARIPRQSHRSARIARHSHRSAQRALSVRPPPPLTPLFALYRPRALPDSRLSAGRIWSGVRRCG